MARRVTDDGSDLASSSRSLVATETYKVSPWYVVLSEYDCAQAARGSDSEKNVALKERIVKAGGGNKEERQKAEDEMQKMLNRALPLTDLPNCFTPPGSAGHSFRPTSAMKVDMEKGSPSTPDASNRTRGVLTHVLVFVSVVATLLHFSTLR